MAGIINWEELRKLAMPQPPPGARGKGGNIFDTDESADMYNRMIKMEKTYTLNQINAFDTAKTDTVLDVGCGPGRISIPMAQRAKSVTALDQSKKMLAHCERNAQEAGVTNLVPCVLDWNDAAVGRDLQPHDIVIASRSVGGSDLQKLVGFARKYVVLVGWANAPNIPIIVGDLFEGIGEGRKFPPVRMGRQLSYNTTYNIVYDMGYEPNIRIVTDGFTRDFASREEAYSELWKLGAAADGIPPKFKENVDKWLTKNNNGGVTFRRETRSYVIWWDPNPVKFAVGIGA